MPTDTPPPLPLTARRWRKGAWESLEEIASREESVRILYEGGECRLWAWPQDLASLALGHVLLDRLHDGPLDGPPHTPRQGNVDTLGVQNSPQGTTEHVLRVRLAPHGGKTRTPEPTPGALDAPTLLTHMQIFLDLPGMWDGTGCFHRAAMLHIPSGGIVVLAEDIGRHNCLDRLAGHAALHGLHPAEHALLLSARITASLYCKARRAGFSLLASRAAVTSAALLRAQRQNVTLVGFCRPQDQRLTVFTDTAGRIRP